jgi:adenylate cyclase
LSRGQRKLVAIMFIDMVGYTTLGQRNESLSLALIDEQRKLIRPILLLHNGKEVKTMGDAFLVQFASVLEAVRCAYDIQRAVKEHNSLAVEEKRFLNRVGLHLGDVVEYEGDIAGDAVNVASRIEPLAENGGVCLSRQVFDHIRGKVDLQFSSIGLKKLKNVIEPIEVYKMMMPWDTEAVASFGTEKSKRIAVLPFVNMSPDPEDEYFADGMTEEIISTISKVSQVEVISRTSVMQYKRTPKPAREVSKELEVSAILEGSVRKAGNKLRITVQLIDAEKDRHVWAESFDREFRDVFEIQSEIAQKVADSLRLRLDDRQKEDISRGPTQNMGAYNSYLAGLHYLNQTGPRAISKSIPYLEQAVGADPNFAHAYAALANAYIYLSGESISPIEAFHKAKLYAERALSLDDQIAEAHWASANLAFQSDWNWDLADTEYKRALEISPNSAQMRQDYATFLMLVSRDDDSIREIFRAMELDPLSGLALGIGVGVHVYGRKYAKAIDLAKKKVKIDPSDPDGHNILAFAYLASGALDESYNELRLARRKIPQSDQEKEEEHLGWAGGLNPWIHAIACTVLAILNKQQMLRDILHEAEEYAKKSFVAPSDLAIMHLALGNIDHAFDLLEEGIRIHETGFIFVHRSQVFDSVRSDPRFLKLLKRCNLPAD